MSAIAAVEPFEWAQRRGGMNEAAFLRAREILADAKRREAEAKKQEAAYLESQMQIKEAKRLMRDRCAPTWVIERLFERAEKYGVSPALLAGKSHQRAIVRVRNELIYSIKATKPGLSAPHIARWFGRDHTTILHAMAQHALNNRGVAELTAYNVRQRRASLAAFHARRRAEAA